MDYIALSKKWIINAIEGYLKNKLLRFGYELLIYSIKYLKLLINKVFTNCK